MRIPPSQRSWETVVGASTGLYTYFEVAQRGSDAGLVFFYRRQGVCKIIGVRHTYGGPQSIPHLNPPLPAEREQSTPHTSPGLCLMAPFERLKAATDSTIWLEHGLHTPPLGLIASFGFFKVLAGVRVMKCIASHARDMLHQILRG